MSNDDIPDFLKYNEVWFDVRRSVKDFKTRRVPLASLERIEILLRSLVSTSPLLDEPSKYEVGELQKLLEKILQDP